MNKREKLNLKVGDKVLITKSGWAGDIESVAVITKVDSSGCYYTNDSTSLYNEYGVKISLPAYSHTTTLSILTPEKEEEIRQNLVIKNCLFHFQVAAAGKELTYLQALEILKILIPNYDEKVSK